MNSADVKTTVNKEKGERLSLLPGERKVSIQLALLFATRMFGLFLLTPVFAVLAQTIPGGDSSVRVGIALGAYGLTQAIMQIPLGMAADRFGRRPVVVGGLIVFIIGGVVAALASSIDGIIVGRILQGLGAISAAITAWVADATRPEVRTRAMAMIGMSIGLSFALSLVVSPVIVGQFGLSGLFWVISLLGFLCLLLAVWGIPQFEPAGQAMDTQHSAFRTVLGNKGLWHLNGGVFVLHAVLMTFFVSMPPILATVMSLGADQLWIIYLPVMLCSFVVMFAWVFYIETRKQHAKMLHRAVGLLGLSIVAMFFAQHNAWFLAIVLWLFFSAFNTLEAMQPSLVSRVATAQERGLALGVYNTMQSLGVFFGAASGGAMIVIWGPLGGFYGSLLLVALWWLSTRKLRLTLQQ